VAADPGEDVRAGQRLVVPVPVLFGMALSERGQLVFVGGGQYGPAGLASQAESHAHSLIDTLCLSQYDLS
jgi:hypothetical protein